MTHYGIISQLYLIPPCGRTYITGPGPKHFPGNAIGSSHNGMQALIGECHRVRMAAARVVNNLYINAELH